MALKPNPMLAALAKAGVNSSDEFVAVTGLVVSADAKQIVLRRGLLSPETVTLSAAEVVYSEQASDAGLALVIVRPDASITVTTTAVAFRVKDGGSGGADPVQACIDRKRQACVDGKMLEGLSRAQAEGAVTTQPPRASARSYAGTTRTASGAAG